MKTPPFHELDTVVLLRDVPEAGLRAGNLGAVVRVYGAEALEVEFVTASGRTQALLTLPTSKHPRADYEESVAGFARHLATYRE